MSKRMKKSISILPSLWEEAKQRAKRGDCSTSRAIERALRLAFNDVSHAPYEPLPQAKRKRATTSSI
jgi:hypothetical protein